MKKRILSHFMAVVAGVFLLISCTAQKEVLDISSEEQAVFDSAEEEPVEIKDEETEYEIIIIEPGFYTWLQSIARPEGYYSQSFLESRNAIMVINWNQRVLQPSMYNPNLYEMQINYDPNIDYGYEVNYKLYNYFVYFQRKYNQRLGPFFPRI
ncbi:hypothetical protein SAMN04487891_10818 [Flagellimonas taeanensis]|jgi:hypothetical protein|uniref:Lipoprotein n=1 Tax=Flagellimonas taeanensis TaxID=1005926 RepID=A0A1M7A4R9_9FLAO|nr:DUF6146 family protein [Allomuricauda taeanensis]SFC26131.1 hypothetical protein SAMN04487891_10818 [Allomuricauda taeanensis]SHL37563.1 hypothetical protein SAMN05216293_3351 [Allomuricauda taeanensis]